LNRRFFMDKEKTASEKKKEAIEQEKTKK